MEKQEYEKKKEVRRTRRNLDEKITKFNQIKDNGFLLSKRWLLIGLLLVSVLGLYAFTQANLIEKVRGKKVIQKDKGTNTFIESTKEIKTLLSPLHYYKNPYEFLDVWLDSPLPLSAYSDEAINWQKELNTGYAKDFILAHSPNKNGDKAYKNDNYDKPISQRNIDNEEITPFTWKYVEIILKKEDGNTLKANLRRPNWWLKKNGADKVGNSVELYMPEMGIGGIGEVTKITPNLLDTRLYEFKWDEKNNTFRPLTGKFERSFTEVWDFQFDNGDVIGATPSHLFYSNDRNLYIPIRDFKIGESVKLENGQKTKLRQKQKRPEKEKVYNLEVWRDHNFHVGESGILVHNDCRVYAAGIREQQIIDAIFPNGASQSQIDDFMQQLGNNLGDVSFGSSTNSQSSLYNFFREGLDGLNDVQKYELTVSRIKTWRALMSKAEWSVNINYLTKVNRYINQGLDIIEEGGELIVKQINGVKVGKLDPYDPYYPGEMKVKGEVSGRHFDPDKAGGPIVKKSWSNPTVTQSGIDDLSTHVARFTGSEAIANNNYMIDRLNEIKNGQRVPDEFDKKFYTHELEEFMRFENEGISNNSYDEIVYQNAHTASLEAYNINELVEKIYPPTVPFPQYAGYY